MKLIRVKPDIVTKLLITIQFSTWARRSSQSQMALDEGLRCTDLVGCDLFVSARLHGWGEWSALQDVRMSSIDSVFGYKGR